MKPNAFDFLNSHTDEITLLSELEKLSDETLCCWLECYGSRLARRRLVRDIEKIVAQPLDTDGLCWRVSHWVEKLNRGCRWIDLFPKKICTLTGHKL